MEFPKIRATFIGAYAERGAWNWQAVPNPPERVEVPGVTAVAAKAIANRRLTDLGNLKTGLDRDFLSANGDIAPRARIRFISALGTVAEFLKEAGFPPFYGAELLELAHALTDLDKGIVHPMLRASGSPQLSGEVWRIRAIIAAAVEIQKSEGAFKKTICEKIAKSHPHFGWPPVSKVGPSTHAQLTGSIAEWHKVFAGGDAPDDLAQTMFDNRAELFRTFTESYGTTDPRALADHALTLATLMMSRANDEHTLNVTKALLEKKMGSGKRG